ncbi:aldehyde ferredoxin oxidoreductase family protein [Thermosphaera aggregans]|uniref:Aldehyde ferredoxin oxidoreductase n=1 Tax=Thermosphaera aggregans (strain DSM 11486 / M11TL) TaxID=633148 RepID=D5TZV0_THEAM|nr:aldehyde ferredoxin oxidoreductase family protein [Thermosphaera aggregans]ADG90400.1 Aldehyde ferredoxin oxidoreductase [Thermosphaera aggregans DSM 11486]
MVPVLPYGFNGRWLRVDLSSKSLKIIDVPEELYKEYLGGRGIASYILFKELKPGIDPLGPENKLVFATSVITGTPIPGVNRIVVAAKSPLTGTYGESEAGGFFAPELKYSGFDVVVVEGASEKPVYLWIRDGRAEIRDATHLWGLTTKETVEEIKKELREPFARIGCIGPAGEKLVRFANIMFEHRYAAGRGGMGAVMGSKKLKAIAVKTSGRSVRFYDEKKLVEIVKWFNDNWKNQPGAVSRSQYGTAELVTPLNKDGTLPTLNFRGGSFNDAVKVSGEVLNKTILVSKSGCFACPIRCKPDVKGEKPYETDPSYGGPEYETITSFGPLCGISDLNVIARANQICNAYGVDTISAGVAVAFAMELFERGIITSQETGGLELRFGSTEGMLRLLEMIVKREGFGNVLAEGVKRAAEFIGRGAEKYAMHVKSREIPMHEPRGKVGVGLQYALSPIGADHVQAPHDPSFERITQHLTALGLTRPVNRLALNHEKVRAVYYGMLWWGLEDCLGICKFVFTPHSAGVLTPNHLVEIVNAATGWGVSLWSLMKASERAFNLARAFNVCEGFAGKDDTLPQRFFEGLEFGARKGQRIDKAEFDKAVKLFYEIAGWDEEGKPTPGKLYELGLDYVVEELYKG